MSHLRKVVNYIKIGPRKLVSQSPCKERRRCNSQFVDERLIMVVRIKTDPNICSKIEKEIIVLSIYKCTYKKIQ